ncbi:MAG TPA: glycogen/starch synthase [Bacteroidota bacterium]|nr:glycogen/starch synthase [Bacteroidota bacterium]
MEATGQRQVIMLGAENDALIAGKVGGVADVIRDLPVALARLGWQTTVITPSYGFLHVKNPSQERAPVRFPFRGRELEAAVYEVTPRSPVKGVTHLVIEHPDMRGEPIYYNDPPEQTFARDATKFAMFCSAAGMYLRDIDGSAVVHLHDWHTGTLLFLQQLHPAFRHLTRFRTVFTIHNLVIQGTRPIRGPVASVQQWFPELFDDQSWIPRWRDPRFKEIVYTPMLAGIMYSRKLNTVSPSYANEILKPSQHANGFYGGEGLEHFLREAHRKHRFFGILNGTEYPEGYAPRHLEWGEFCAELGRELKSADKCEPLKEELLRRVGHMSSSPPKMMLTSVTRIVEQKMRILFERGINGLPAWQELQQLLDRYDGVYCIVGNGTADYERELREISRESERILFFNFFSARVSELLFANGTIFMMPSIFEPCGIGQMNAMRDGQPCIVHATGGLRDTIIDGVNGFQFAGTTYPEKVGHMLAVTEKAIRVVLSGAERWESIRHNAAAARFTWDKSARQYADLLYV